MKKVVASGYFDPIHVGHIKYLQEAKKLGDKLIVIINNDFQAKRKKGKPFMRETERAVIVGELKCVDSVRISLDTDETVCNTLRAIHPDIFANGGDRTSDEVPETEVCRELGIEMVFGVGGKKIQSSSNLIKNAK